MRFAKRAVLVVAVFLWITTGFIEGVDPSGKPPEVQNQLFTTKTVQTWNTATPSDSYNVYKGDVGNLPSSHGSCFASGLTATTVSDSGIPAPGHANFYLVTASKAALEGTMGYDSNLVERNNSSPCVPFPPPLRDLINPNGVQPDGLQQGVEAPRNPGTANDLTGLAGGGVYLHTLEFYAQVTDLVIPGRGINLQMTRTYRSQITHNGQIGRNWTWNYDRRIMRLALSTCSGGANPGGPCSTSADCPGHCTGAHAGANCTVNGDCTGTCSNDGSISCASNLRCRFCLNDPSITCTANVNCSAVGGNCSAPGTCSGIGTCTNPNPGVCNAPPLTYLDGAGRQDTYQLSGGLYLPTVPGIYNKIRPNPDGSFTLRERDGTLYNHFALNGSPTQGALSSIEDRLGNKITFIYFPNGQLCSATDTLGRTINYYWNAQGRLDTVADYYGREVHYDYDASGHLIFATRPRVVGTSTANDFPSGKTTAYTYSSGTGNPKLDDNLLTITAPGDSVPIIQNSYNANDELVQQLFGGTNASGIPAGGFTIYTSVPLGGGSRQTNITDRNGFQHQIISDPAGHETQEVTLTAGLRAGEPPSYTTSHVYNPNGERIQTTFPAGNSVLMSYDDVNSDLFQRGNLLSITRIADSDRPDIFGNPVPNIVVSYQYEPVATQQRVITDPLGRVTTYTYDYQEPTLGASGLSTYAAVWGINLGGITTGLGDVNGDASIAFCNFSVPTSGHHCGNPEVLDQPTVTLLAGGRQAAIEGASTQPVRTVWRYNSKGQLTTEVEPERNVKTYSYFPETDPDGDGVTTPPPVDGRVLDGGTGGYLATTRLDADPTPYLSPSEIAKRDNSTNPAVASILNEHFYDPVGNMTRSIDGNGNEILYEVNALGQQVSIRRGRTSYRSTNNSSDPPVDGFISQQIFNERDEIVSRRVQDLGNLSATGGFIDTNFTMDILGNVVTVAAEEGNGIFRTTQHRYDTMGNRTATTQPAGNTNTMKFDERNFLFKLVRGDNDLDAGNGGGPGSSTQTYNYDDNGNPEEFIDGKNTSWPFFYDGMDRRIQAHVNPGVVAFSTIYNADETVKETRIHDASHTYNQSQFFYDELGRTKEVRQAIRNNVGSLLTEDFDHDGFTSVLSEYDRNSRLSRSSSDARHNTDFNYDGAGRMVRKTDPVGNHADFTYDDDNNILTTLEFETGFGTETFQKSTAYDRLNRITQQLGVLGQNRSYQYDSRDNLIKYTDALQNTVQYAYNGLNKRTQVIRDIRANGHGPGPVTDQHIYKFDYDANSMPIRMTDPLNHKTEYLYDSLDRLARTTFDDQTKMMYGYDPNDNVVSLTDANNSVVSINFDALDRPIQKSVAPAPGTHANTQTYQYDALNRLTQVVDQGDGGSGERTQIDMTYDSLNKTRTETSQYGATSPITLTYAYDGEGNRLTMAYPGVNINYSPDPLDRLNTMNASPSGVNATWAYIGPERVAQRQHGNGTKKSFFNAPGTIDIGYDGIKRIKAINHYGSGGSTLAGFNYTYDTECNITSETRTHHVGRGDTYVYDSAYRLVDFKRDVDNPAQEAAVPGTGGLIRRRVEYTLDKVGNWLTRRINGTTLLGNTPNNLNEYDEPQSGGTRIDDGIPNDVDDNLGTPAADGVNLGHDRNGDLTKEATKTYEYDAYHRLITVRNSGPTVAHYVYDGLNRRIAKQDFTTGTQSRFLYDGDRLIEERDITGGTIRRRFYYGAEGTPIAMENVSAAPAGVYYLHEDVRNNIVMMTSSAGAVLERYTYDYYGIPEFQDPSNNPTGATKSPTGNPFLYGSNYYDPETQFYEHRGAIFSPRHGRHIQRFLPGQCVGPQGSALNPPHFFCCPISWFGCNPFWWSKFWFWNIGNWNCGWWAWRPFWWFGGPWGWWWWRPWVWTCWNFNGWWCLRPWNFWWCGPWRWWGWQAWWGWPGWWGWWPWWGWGGWCNWLPAWGWLGWVNWWPWWGWGGWCGWWPSYGWWGWCGWWPWWNGWWGWTPWWWNGWWTPSWFWWSNWWGPSCFTFWWNWWSWLSWWPWGWWNWGGWWMWWGWIGWNPWWWWGWWGWWWWGGPWCSWWWGPMGWDVWFGWGYVPWWWWGWWAWLFPWGWWFWGWGWWPFWCWWRWWGWWWGWWGWPWWGWWRWWGWWWPWWGWWC